MAETKFILENLCPPENVRGIRIGQCFNMETGEALMDLICDSDQLLKKGFLNEVPGNWSREFVQASEYSLEDVTEKLGIAVKVEGAYSAVSASGQVVVNDAKNRLSSNLGKRCLVTNIFKEHKISIINLEEFKGLLQDDKGLILNGRFRELFLSILNEADDYSRFRKMDKFFSTYGHGIVTGIYLTKAAIIEANLTVGEGGEHTVSDNEIKGKIGTTSAGFNLDLAVNWSKDAKAQFKNSKFVIKSKVFPEDTALMAWAKNWEEGLYTKFSEKENEKPFNFSEIKFEKTSFLPDKDKVAPVDKKAKLEEKFQAAKKAFETDKPDLVSIFSSLESVKDTIPKDDANKDLKDRFDLLFGQVLLKIRENALLILSNERIFDGGNDFMATISIMSAVNESHMKQLREKMPERAELRKQQRIKVAAKIAEISGTNNPKFGSDEAILATMAFLVNLNAVLPKFEKTFSDSQTTRLKDLAGAASNKVMTTDLVTKINTILGTAYQLEFDPALKTNLESDSQLRLSHAQDLDENPDEMFLVALSSGETESLEGLESYWNDDSERLMRHGLGESLDARIALAGESGATESPKSLAYTYKFEVMKWGELNDSFKDLEALYTKSIFNQVNQLVKIRTAFLEYLSFFRTDMEYSDLRRNYSKIFLDDPNSFLNAINNRLRDKSRQITSAEISAILVKELEEIKKSKLLGLLFEFFLANFKDFFNVYYHGVLIIIDGKNIMSVSDYYVMIESEKFPHLVAAPIKNGVFTQMDKYVRAFPKVNLRSLQDGQSKIKVTFVTFYDGHMTETISFLQADESKSIYKVADFKLPELESKTIFVLDKNGSKVIRDNKEVTYELLDPGILKPDAEGREKEILYVEKNPGRNEKLMEDWYYINLHGEKVYSDNFSFDKFRVKCIEVTDDLIAESESVRGKSMFKKVVF
jgi:hypothetical protein